MCNLLRKAIDIGWRGSCSPIFAMQERSWVGAMKTCDSAKIQAKEIKARLFPMIHQKQLNKEVPVPLRSLVIASGSCDVGLMTAGWTRAQETLLFLWAVKVALVTPTNAREGKGSLEEEAPSVVASSVSYIGFQENNSYRADLAYCILNKQQLLLYKCICLLLEEYGKACKYTAARNREETTAL